MELSELVARTSDFGDWKHADKIRLFVWFQHVYGGKGHVQAADVAACYDALHLRLPASIHSFLRSLFEQKHLLKSSSGYRLELKIRERLDRAYGRREETVAVEKMLSSLAGKLSSARQRDYLEETLKCFRHQAWRAATIMAWNLAYDHLLRFVEKHKLTQFNASLAKNTERKKRTEVKTRDEFADLREGLVLEVCRASDAVSGALFKLLKRSLDDRNDAAHPSGAIFNKMKTEAYISELVETVVVGLTV